MTLTVTTPDTPNATLSLHGEGFCPNISVTPTQIVATIDVPTSRSARHGRNTGASNLTFDIPAVRPAVVVVPRYSALELGHGCADPRLDPGERWAGYFGYRWVDSDEPNGPTFSWVDITAWLAVGLAGDDQISIRFRWG